MADHELSPEEGLQLLHELFGSVDHSALPTRGCRKYVLEFRHGEPVFRFADMLSNKSAPMRDGLEVWFVDLMTELFGPDSDGNEIVPEKLAKRFPRSSFGPRR
jgi:hypothetical protein